MATDLTAAAAEVRAGRRSAAELLDASLAAARSPACRDAFVRLEVAHAGDAAQPLAGLAVSVKDLFDVRGLPTTAASRTLADAPPAARDSDAVARLRAAGAALLAHTNMSEFAYSGVGLNPHFGTPANPATAALDAEPRIPGGSTSGGAVSVAAGAAWAALGSDTGGSIRIPAALCGLVGFKNTQALTPLGGTLPLSPTRDTACAITRSVRDAVLLHEVLAARRVTLAGKPLAAMRFALPRHVFLDGLDERVARTFERALRRVRDAGATVVEASIDGLETAEVPQALVATVAAEAWAWHRERLAHSAALYDPRVERRIRRGATLSPADLDALRERRARWQAQVAAALEGFDAVIAPTVPVIAPPIAPLLTDDDRFTATNLLLLRNPTIVNQLDGCAISLPCHEAGDWPVGLMLFSTAHRDTALLDAALRVEAALR
jgi:aspartyl-tRNA(Asn)/glutamyl-tRNA(Gln) amidotransferase subunit A